MATAVLPNMTIETTYAAHLKWSQAQSQAVKAARVVLERLMAQTLVTQDIVAGVENIEVLRAYLLAEADAKSEFIAETVGDM